MRRGHLFLITLPLLFGWLHWKDECAERWRSAPEPAALAWDAAPDDGERMLERRFSVAPGGLLAVQVSDADVRVETGADGEAHVEIFLKARDLRSARRYFERQRFSVTQEGDRIVVTTDPERDRPFTFRPEGGARILVRARVPARFDAELQTADGNVTLGALRGRIQVRTSDGDIETAALTGPAVGLRTSDGDIRTARIEADEVTLQTSDGNLVLREIVASHISVRTSDGDITADLLEGSAEAVTSDGDLYFQRLRGPSMNLRTSDGDVTADELVAERAEVRTSDGSITLQRVDGPLRASTSSGHIQVALLKPADVSLRAGDGDITVTAPTSLPADLDLRGERVFVASSYRFEGQLEKDTAAGTLNGGGPRLEAHTSDGAVYLQDH